MCAHIFFRLSLSSFIINTLKTNYLTSFSLTILTLCVIIFLKTVITFISTIYALNFHWFHKILYISEIQTKQSNLQIVTAEFLCDTCHHFFSHHHSTHLPFLRSKRYSWLAFFPKEKHPSASIFMPFSVRKPSIASCFWGAWLHKSSIVCCVSLCHINVYCLTCLKTFIFKKIISQKSSNFEASMRCYE